MGVGQEAVDGNQSLVQVNHYRQPEPYLQPDHAEGDPTHWQGVLHGEPPDTPPCQYYGGLHYGQKGKLDRGKARY